jgi:hypothetical protein
LDAAGEDRGVAQPTDNGYALAWYGKTAKAGEIALKFEQRDKAGVVSCGPINLYTFSATTPAAPPVVVPYRGGYFVVSGVDVQLGSSTYAMKLRAFVLNEGCGDTQVNFLLAPSYIHAAFRPRVAIGDETMIVTWADLTGKFERLVTGRNLCLP